MLTCHLSAICNLEGTIDFHYGWLLNGVAKMLRGIFFLFLNRIWGNQAKTRRWALEIKPKGYRCGVSSPKQEIEAAP